MRVRAPSGELGEFESVFVSFWGSILVCGKIDDHAVCANRSLRREFEETADYGVAKDHISCMLPRRITYRQSGNHGEIYELAVTAL